jgi:predicted Ser/Thr protein kinase
VSDDARSNDTIPPELAQWLALALGSAADGAAGDAGELLGAGYQGTVRLYRSPVGDVVVKAPREGAVLGFLGRRALRREHRAYERLAGVPGVPRCFGLYAGRYLVLEHIAGASYREGEKALVDRERFFAALLASIDAMHAAGVAHGDLKRKDNLLIGPGERPYLIDFGIARLRRGPAGREGSLFRWIAQMDLNAWIKLKYRKRIEALSAADAARYSPLLLERVARWLRIPWQTITLRRPRQRWRRRREERRQTDPDTKRG